VTYRQYSGFVVADIPGLIEGAHEGKGLGHQFLRHIERTGALAYLIDVTDEDPVQTFLLLKRELSEYSHLLSIKPYIIVLTKMDVIDEADLDFRFDSDETVIKISAVTGSNLEELKDTLYQLVCESQDDFQ
jgi:GTP-binding protein